MESRRRIKRYRDPFVRPSVCPSLGYRHAGCLQLSHVRTADPSADGRRSAASRTVISSRRPLGDDFLIDKPGTCRQLLLITVCCSFTVERNAAAAAAAGGGGDDDDDVV